MVRLRVAICIAYVEETSGITFQLILRRASVRLGFGVEASSYKQQRNGILLLSVSTYSDSSI